MPFMITSYTHYIWIKEGKTMRFDVWFRSICFFFFWKLRWRTSTVFFVSTTPTAALDLFSGEGSYFVVLCRRRLWVEVRENGRVGGEEREKSVSNDLSHMLTVFILLPLIPWMSPMWRSQAMDYDLFPIVWSQSRGQDLFRFAVFVWWNLSPPCWALSHFCLLMRPCRTCSPCMYIWMGQKWAFDPFSPLFSLFLIYSYFLLFFFLFHLLVF